MEPLDELGKATEEWLRRQPPTIALFIREVVSTEDLWRRWTEANAKRPIDEVFIYEGD